MSTGQDYNPTDSIQQLDQKIRSLQLKVERLTDEFQQVDQKMDVHGGRLRRWLVAVAVLVIVGVGHSVTSAGGNRSNTGTAQASSRQRDSRRNATSRNANAWPRKPLARKLRQFSRSSRRFAERFLQQLSMNQGDQGRGRSSAWPSEELAGTGQACRWRRSESLIDRKIAREPAREEPLVSRTGTGGPGQGQRRRGIREAADEQKQQGRELAMLEGTAALAGFVNRPSRKWERSRPRRIPASHGLAEPNSPTEWQAWTDAAVSAASVLHDLARYAEAEPLLRDATSAKPTSAGLPGRRQVLNNLASCSRPRTGWRRPSRSSAARWRSTSSRTARTTPTSPSTSTTWRCCSRPRTGWPRPSRSFAARWRSTSSRTARTTPTSPSASTTWRRCSRPRTGWRRPSRSSAGRWRSTSGRTAPTTPTSPSASTTWRRCSRPRTGWRRPSRSIAAPWRSTRGRYGPDHPDVAIDLNNLAALLQATNRLAEAEPLYRRALAIDERSYGPDHPDVAIDLNNLAQLLQATNRLAEAEPLYRRAAGDRRAVVRPRPPRRRDRPQQPGGVAPGHEPPGGGRAALSPRAGDRRAVVRPGPPRRRHRPQQPGGVAPGHEPPVGGRAALSPRLAIDERSYGPEHPDVASDLNNLAGLLQATNRLAEAEPLMARAVRILSRFQRSTGHEHPHLRVVMSSNYRQLLAALKLAEPEIASADQGGEGGDGQAVADRPRGGATPRPGQTGRGRAGIPGSPVQGAGQAGRLFPQAERTDRPASRRAAPAERGWTELPWESPPSAGVLMPTRSCSTKPRWSSWPTNPHRPRRSSGPA